MFRSLVNQSRPEYFLLCDDSSCGTFVRSDIPVCKDVQDALRAEAHFIGLVMKDGWLVNLRMQLCPDHTGMLREMARQQQLLARHGLGNGQARIVEPTAAEQKLVEITKVKPL